MYKWILSIVIIILLGATTYLLIHKTEGNIYVKEKEEIQEQTKEDKTEVETPIKTPKYQVQTYTVQERDTLSSIAEKTKISVETITWNNNLTSSPIKTGDTLRIPSQDGLLLTVKEGDTIETLAKEYSVTTQSIIDMNDLGTTLEVGKEIFIPNAKKEVIENPVVEEPISNWWNYPKEILTTTKSGNDLLVLVDKKYKLPSSYAPTDLVNVSSTGIRTKGTITVRSVVLTDLKSMAKAAKADGIDLSIVSGYRSYTTQQSTYNYWVQYNGGDVDTADTISARPGHSQHQLGTAIDFSTNEINDGIGMDFNNTKAAKWLEENAYKYGFALAFPQGYEGVTGYAYESWHFRYIGIDNALTWKQSGLILEQWLQQLNP